MIFVSAPCDSLRISRRLWVDGAASRFIGPPLSKSALRITAEWFDPILPPSLLDGGDPMMKEDFCSIRGTGSCLGGGMSTFAVTADALLFVGLPWDENIPDIDPAISP